MEADFTPELIKALVQLATGLPANEEIVEWATSELVCGKDSQHLRILAGLSKPYHWSEVDQIFRKALSELSIPLPTPEETLWRYARWVASEMLSGKMPLSEGVNRLYHLCSDMDYPQELVVWAGLDDEWIEMFNPLSRPYLATTEGGLIRLTEEEAAKLIELSKDKIALLTQMEG